MDFPLLYWKLLLEYVGSRYFKRGNQGLAGCSGEKCFWRSNIWISLEFEIYASFSRESGKINLGRVNFIPRPTIFPQISFRSLFAPDDSIRFLFFEMKSEWKYSRRRALPWWTPRGCARPVPFSSIAGTLAADSFEYSCDSSSTWAERP